MDDKGHRGRRTRAPVASVEDLSDESPEDRSRLGLPGRMTTPRIDISRASSSSHQEDSSPERELLAGDGPPGKLALGFAEEMAQELRSSTEELDFHDPDEPPETTKTRRKTLQSQQAVQKYDLETAIKKETAERKDSSCSEGFLFIGGGRTSRLSSIGSAASGGSVASVLSGGSAASHLSAASNYSRASRCSSPHRLLLETSFCGPKPIASLSVEAKDPEAAILVREIDPSDAVIPKIVLGKPPADKPDKPPQEPKDVRPRRRPKKKNIPDDRLVRIVPLHGSVDDDDDDAPPEQAETRAPLPPPEEGIYIPLKGPDPGRPDRPRLDRREARAREAVRTAQVEAFRREDRERDKDRQEPGVRSKEQGPIIDGDLVQFISLHEDAPPPPPAGQNRNGHNVQFRPWAEEDPPRRKARTPEPGRPPRMDVVNHGTRTPSPASSFRGVFRRSSDSSSSSKRSSQGGSSHSRRDSKNKSLFGSFFKKGTKERSPQSVQRTSQRSTNLSTDAKSITTKQERKPAEPDQIIIPLHSPDSVVEPLIVVERVRMESEAVFHEPHESSTGPQEGSSEVYSETVAISVLVVDVLNEDKVVAFEELQKGESAESIKCSDRMTIEEQEERVKRKSTDSTTALSPEEKITEDRSEEIFVQSENDKRQSLLAEEKEVEIVSTTEDDTSAAEHVLRSDSTSGLASCIEDKLTNSLEDCLSRDTEELAQKSTTTESSEITIIENHIIGKGEDDEERKSSESETFVPKEKEASVEDDMERKSLFQQADSVEEELPYVPTTLPQERLMGVPILPVKQRVSEIKTCPIERPRSTTPIIPTCLDDYTSHDGSSTSSSSSGKMQIVLPRSDSIKGGRQKGCGAKPWAVFAGECLQSPKEARRTGPQQLPQQLVSQLPQQLSISQLPQQQLPQQQLEQLPTQVPHERPQPVAPQLPPRSSTASAAAGWVCFDDTPERQRLPRRITTLPRPGPSSTAQSSILYSYVNPEECSCECHDTAKHCSQVKQ